MARRVAWLEDYVSLILVRDVRDIANIDQLDRLPRLLNILAEHAGQLTNNSSFEGLSGVTTQKYIAILERLFLVKTLAPWSNNRLSRLVKTPKLHFIDTGLLATLHEDELARLSEQSPVRCAAGKFCRLGAYEASILVRKAYFVLTLQNKGSR